MHNAKTQFSELVRESSDCELLLFPKSGKSIVKVNNCKDIKRLGFILGEGKKDT